MMPAQWLDRNSNDESYLNKDNSTAAVSLTVIM